MANGRRRRKRKKRGFWRDIGKNIFAAAVWESIVKPLSLAALSLLGLLFVTLKRFVPEQNWASVMITALLITLSVIIPVFLLLVSLRRPRRFDVLARVGDLQMKGREIRGDVPRATATNEEVDAWLERVQDWTQGAIDFLQDECSLHAGARFIDDSNMTGGDYPNVHPKAQHELLVLNRRLANLSVIMDSAEQYCA